MTQANSNVAFPFASASIRNFSISSFRMTPVSTSRRPTVVDLPWSTWPMKTMLRWGFGARRKGTPI
jgi:hypothetical protein